MNKTIQQHQNQINKLCQKENISYLALFGSQAREDQQENSDIDLIVDFSTPGGLLRRARVKLLLEEILGAPVDLLSRRALNEKLKPFISQDSITLYEKA